MPDSTGQLLILGVPGPELTPDDAALIRRIQPGGFILSGRNIVSLEQTRQLTDRLRELCEIEPFLCIDNEGGDTWHTAPLGHIPPSAGELRHRNDPNLVARHGWATGRLLRMLGLNFNLAPVLDLDIFPEADNAMRGRCWGESDQDVINHAGVFNRYQRRQGILGCGKHFPAGGRAALEAHHELPSVDFSIEELLRSDLLPYTALMPELDGIMVSHIHFPRLDPDHPGLPASLSRRIITGLLRDQLGYKGLVVTDDLDMGAIQNSFASPEAARLAVEAGADLLLLCHETGTAPDVLAALDGLPGYLLGDILDRIERAKKRLHAPAKYSPETFAELNDDVGQLRNHTIGTPD